MHSHGDESHEHSGGEVDHTHSEVQLNLMEISHWIEYGVEQGWCGPPMCHAHDGAPPENDEHGCGLYIRVYKTIEEQDWVEANHENTREFLKRFEKQQWPTSET